MGAQGAELHMQISVVQNLASGNSDLTPQCSTNSAKARGDSNAPGFCRKLSKDLGLRRDTKVDFEGSSPRSEEPG